MAPAPKEWAQGSLRPASVAAIKMDVVGLGQRKGTEAGAGIPGIQPKPDTAPTPPVASRRVTAALAATYHYSEQPQKWLFRAGKIFAYFRALCKPLSSRPALRWWNDGWPPRNGRKWLASTATGRLHANADIHLIGQQQALFAYAVIEAIHTQLTLKFVSGRNGKREFHLV
jgi:hypothetical protein